MHKGFYNWKDALHKFHCHEKFVAHITAAKKWVSALEVQKNPERDVHFQMNQQNRAEVQENRQCIKFIVETLQFLGRQRLAFCGDRENDKSLNKGIFWSFSSYRPEIMLPLVNSKRIAENMPHIQAMIFKTHYWKSLQLILERRY